GLAIRSQQERGEGVNPCRVRREDLEPWLLAAGRQVEPKHPRWRSGIAPPEEEVAAVPAPAEKVFAGLEADDEARLPSRQRIDPELVVRRHRREPAAVRRERACRPGLRE